MAWGQEGKYSTTLFTQRARKILESHDPKSRPLFLLLSLQVRRPDPASVCVPGGRIAALERVASRSHVGHVCCCCVASCQDVGTQARRSKAEATGRCFSEVL